MRFDKEHDFIEEFLSRYWKIVSRLYLIVDSVGQEDFEENTELIKTSAVDLRDYYDGHRILLNEEPDKAFDNAVTKVSGFLRHAELDNGIYGKEEYNEDYLADERSEIQKIYSDLVEKSRSYLNSMEVSG